MLPNINCFVEATILVGAAAAATFVLIQWVRFIYNLLGCGSDWKALAVLYIPVVLVLIYVFAWKFCI